MTFLNVCENQRLSLSGTHHFSALNRTPLSTDAAAAAIIGWVENGNVGGLKNIRTI